ncbi:unnamed protein product [Cyprideis torosa]|uniref:Uncharacterized protein n=1 Tax=Cyprideis torosa TaxID=163714 RepID=A0A7R8W9L2_9CRUS|nr:unnamed protein product [Cyprideis torosa]CAG0885456.1 unnamed protein product [Cyprideis torosa]
MYKVIAFCAILAVATSEKSSSTRISFGGQGSDSGEVRRIVYQQPRVVYQQPRVVYQQPRVVYRQPSSYGDASSEYTRPEYNFNWVVRDDYSGIDMGHQENRDGDNTQGSYRVLLPDGRIQTVTYYVDGDSGYVANVQYEGEARYDNSGESRRSGGGYGRPILIRYRGGSRERK